MRKLLVVVLALAMMTGMAYANSSKTERGGTNPVILDTGGPDNFGYSWEDNDGGGTVPYAWKEIDRIGTRVDGLLDDNTVGPFPMGFNFPYYWYDVNRVWIGSNGYISFSSNANFAHPFQNIPYRSQPNDLLCPLTGDLTFVTDENPPQPLPFAKCYYWSNSVDSFVVEWKQVGEFGENDSLHTFEIVLDANDSTITFYYGEQHGDFLDSNGEHRNVIGIENVTGTVGLQYLRDNAPTGHMFHDQLALRFHPEPNPNFIWSDVGVSNIFNSQNGAKIHAVGYESEINAEVKNFGTQAEGGFNVSCQIRNPGNTVVYNDTVSIDGQIASGGSEWVVFEPFTPDQAGQYRVDIKTLMSPDSLAGNNAQRAELRAVAFQAGENVDIRYDDGTAENGRSWNGDFSGFGNEFESPYLPMQVHSVTSTIFGVTSNGNLHVWVMDDDGTGNPGEILAADTLAVRVGDTEATADFESADITINQGKVFAIAISETQVSQISIGMDETATTPFSYRGWEYTGGLAGDRDRDTDDIMIGINVTATPTAVPDHSDANLPSEASLGQNYPNPFNPTTSIDYSLPANSHVSLDVFNIIGQKVKTLVDADVAAGTHNVTWDGTTENGIEAASGVYFYKLSVDDQVMVKRMTLLK